MAAKILRNADGRPQHRSIDAAIKDNKVLPQPLQERKEAETLQQEAERYIAREQQALVLLASQIAPIARSVTAPLPALPEDLAKRLKRYYKTARPSAWCRITQALSAP